MARVQYILANTLLHIGMNMLMKQIPFWGLQFKSEGEKNCQWFSAIFEILGNSWHEFLSLLGEKEKKIAKKCSGLDVQESQFQEIETVKKNPLKQLT